MVRSLAVLLSIRDEDVNIQEVFHTPNEQLVLNPFSLISLLLVVVFSCYLLRYVCS